MFFKRKQKKEEAHCPNCKSGVINKFSFCPYCGESLLDEEDEAREFGMLGKDDIADEEIVHNAFANTFGITDRIMGSLVSSLMKNLNVQIKEIRVHEADAAEVKELPNGIRIQLNNPHAGKQKSPKLLNRAISDKQLERLNALPRAEAKTNIRRLSDKVVYELAVPGVASPEDVFVSKLESGYEIKAISKNKVYVNSVPVNLPLKSLAVSDKGLIVEFGLR